MRLLLLFIIFSTAHAGVLIRTTGVGNLDTSLDATQCQAYAAELGAPYSWDGVVDSNGQAVGCSVVEANKKVRYNDRATSGQACGNSIKCIDFVLDIPPVEYIQIDPGEVSSLDRARSVSYTHLTLPTILRV